MIRVHILLKSNVIWNHGTNMTRLWDWFEIANKLITTPEKKQKLYIVYCAFIQKSYVAGRLNVV